MLLQKTPLKAFLNPPKSTLYFFGPGAESSDNFRSFLGRGLFDPLKYVLSAAGALPPELHPGASECGSEQAFAYSWIAAPSSPATRAKTGRTAQSFCNTRVGADFWEGDATKLFSVKKKGFSVKRGGGGEVLSE